MDYKNPHGGESVKAPKGKCQLCDRHTVLKFYFAPLRRPYESSLHRNNDVSNLAPVFSDIIEAEHEVIKLDQEIARLQAILSSRSFKGDNVRLQNNTTHEETHITPIQKDQSDSIPGGICKQCTAYTELKSQSSHVLIPGNKESEMIDKKISHLEETLPMLKHRKEELEIYMINQRSLLAPIRKLPEDVLSYIFLECESEDDPSYGGYYFFPKGTQSVIYKLQRVCRYWQSIVLSTPKLWTRIDKVHRCDVKKDEQRMRSYLLHCITLSREAPLTIELPYRIEELGEECIQALSKSVHRFQHIQETSSNVVKEICSCLLKDTSGIFENLKTLSMGLDGDLIMPPTPNLTHVKVDWMDKVVVSNSVVFQSIPSLTHLEMRYIKYHCDMFGDFPWPQITQFTSILVKYRKGELSNIIQRLKNAVSLIVYDEFIMSNHVNFSDLVNLKLSYVRKPFNALEFVTAPNLKKLELGTGFEPFGMQRVIDFIQRSNCELDELAVQNETSEPFDEQWQTKHFKNLKKLTLQHKSLATFSSNLRWLNRAITPGFLPSLEVLKITTVREIGLVDEIITAVKSRMLCVENRTLSSDSKESYLAEVNIYFWHKMENTEPVEKWKEFARSNGIKSEICLHKWAEY